MRSCGAASMPKFKPRANEASRAGGRPAREAFQFVAKQ